MLDFDYELIVSQTIQAVLGVGRQVINDQSVHYDRIGIKLSAHTVLIDVDENTDEIRISATDNEKFAADEVVFSDIPELNACVGKELGWCWEGTNSQGYQDTFSISVSGIEPDYCFVGIASAVQLNKITRIVSRE